MAFSEENSADSHPEVAEQLEGLLDLLIDLQLVDQNKLIEEQGEPDSTSEPSANDSTTVVEEVATKKLSPEKSQEILEKKPRASPESQEAVNSLEDLKDRSDLSDLRELIANLEEKLAHLEEQVYEPTELINPLLPLIRELLSLKSNQSREAILEAVVPVIDQVIQQRSAQVPEKMGTAIAPIIPTAISQETKDSPAEIAKAIAPEIAVAIQEQIRLDRDSISRTLGPEMGEAIKVQIREERDVMVDALYPVIGNTISKYMVELVQSINEKVETALSPEGINRKIRAKIQGVSEAELILQETAKFTVRAIFLIHKASGLVIREVQPSSEHKLEADMVAGMLTAIRSFANDCIAQPGEVSELHEIDYNDAKIILEVAGYCYLAVVVKGEPSQPFIEKLRETLSQIILKYDRAIAAFDGDRATIPNSVELLLEKLTEPEAEKKKSKPPIALLFLLLAIILPWGIIQWRSSVASRIEAETAVALDAAPELSVYRIIASVDRGKLTLRGRVPNQYLRDKAGQIASEAAPHLELDNQIIAVDVPPDPVLTAGEVERVSALFNQEEEVAISTRYQENTVTVEGTISDQSDAQRITQAMEQIPGVRSVVTTVQVEVPNLKTRIYFDSNSTQLKSSEISSKINSIEQFLARNPAVHLKIVGHSDSQGNVSHREKLAIGRARVVQQALIAQGVEPVRLHISGSLKPPPDVTAEQPLRLSRCVRFEVFIPTVTRE